jgi:hypothetical protein
MDTQMRAVDGADAITSDVRWAAWVARGVKQDRETRKRALGAVVIVAGALGVWLSIALLLG